MIDTQRLAEILTEYKANFINTGWEKEREAVKVFQDNWNINAENFPEMLEKALSGTGKLLKSIHFPSRDRLVSLAKDAPEEVRSLITSLFDESGDLADRVDLFTKGIADIRDRYEPKHNHYQNESAISTYLWLRYPDKYYVYKYSVARALASNLNYDYKFKKSYNEGNIKNAFQMYDEICGCLKTDHELIDLYESYLTDTCYPDPEYKTLAMDVGYYVKENYTNEEDENDGEWHHLNDRPTFTVDEWVEMINDPTIFDEKSRQVIWRMKDIGGAATCVALADKYGEDYRFYKTGVESLGFQIAKTKGFKPGGWSIPCVGRNAKKTERGAYVWKLRDELSEALDQVDLSDVKLYADGYPKDNSAEAVEDVETVAETTLNVEETIHYDPYSKEDFLKDVFMDEKRYYRLVAVLKNKKNIILQGAPGVGKTFAAKRLAYSIMGEKDEGRVQFVQFHQNYSYEDFMMGYRPSGEGFRLEHGIFYDFCRTASNSPDKNYFFIIDEINRGNMSKIFGELLMLIEADKRGEKIKLASSGELFSVPKNLYIIGMMNTADRSLAMIDYALRRRFSFFTMDPAFDSKGFMDYQKKLGNDRFDKLIDKVKQLNQAITDDKSLGKGFCIGHSYFCGWEECTDIKIEQVIEFDILPMLEEYWFDETSKYERWTKEFWSIFE